MINFDDKFIENLKEKINIVDVIGCYCQLSRKGGSYWACCPLPGHSEKTPSFSVQEAGQFFHCFGCGKGGDVIKFIQEVENLEFLEAVKFLCEKYNIELPQDNDKSDGQTTRKLHDKERIKALLRDCALFYVGNLKSENSIKHRNYIEKRKLTKKEVTAFGLGASLDFDSLPKYLLKKGYTQEEMITAGVVQLSKKTNEVYDFQANRLIFPIIDQFGSVIAFGGRELEKKDFAKYKNTGETLLFNKRKTLYNINNLKKLHSENGKLDYVIMVEGYMDTISIYKAGFYNVVASMGTALTIEQARLLKRYTDTVLICYDGDSAGQKATIRGLEILADNNLEVKIVSLPDGLDPDEIINQRGASAYETCLKQALPLIDYKLKLVKDSSDLTSLNGKRNYIGESLNVIRQCKDQFLQEELLKKLRDESGITFDALKRDLEKGIVESVDNQPIAQDIVQKKQKDSSIRSEAEQFILYALINKKPYTKNVAIEKIEFTNSFYNEVATFLMAKKQLNKDFDITEIRDFIGEEKLGELLNVLECNQSVGKELEHKYFYDCLFLLELDSLNERLEQLNLQFKSQTEYEKRQEIAKQIMDITIKIAQIKNRKL